MTAKLELTAEQHALANEVEAWMSTHSLQGAWNLAERFGTDSVLMRAILGHLIERGSIFAHHRPGRILYGAESPHAVVRIDGAVQPATPKPFSPLRPDRRLIDRHQQLIAARAAYPSKHI